MNATLFEQDRMSPKDARRIGVMWGKHGKNENGHCKNCVHFVARSTPAGSHYSKCEEFGISCGPGTDWNGRFIACGKFAHRGSVAEPGMF